MLLQCKLRRIDSSSYCPMGNAHLLHLSDCAKIGALNPSNNTQWDHDSKEVSSGGVFLKLYNRQERFRQKDFGHSKPFKKKFAKVTFFIILLSLSMSMADWLPSSDPTNTRTKIVYGLLVTVKWPHQDLNQGCLGFGKSERLFHSANWAMDWLKIC